MTGKMMLNAFVAEWELHPFCCLAMNLFAGKQVSDRIVFSTKQMCVKRRLLLLREDLICRVRSCYQFLDPVSLDALVLCRLLKFSKCLMRWWLRWNLRDRAGEDGKLNPSACAELS